MDAAAILARTESVLSGRVLQKGHFGRFGAASAWIEMSTIQEVARVLRRDPELALDFLENLSVVEMDGALVLTYFVSSSVFGHMLVLRGSVVPKDPRSAIEVLSVEETWPTAGAMERENEELFGVMFGGDHRRKNGDRPGKHWKGFPLRKSWRGQGSEGAENERGGP